MNRRELKKTIQLGTSKSMMAVGSFLPHNQESSGVNVHSSHIPIHDLPPSLDGFKIAQISDIHLEPYTKKELVKQAISIVNSLNPDLIILTGDYVWLDVESIFELTPLLANLKAEHGVVSILGNHDIYEGVEVVKSGFRSANLPLYINQGFTVANGKGSLYMACLDDGRIGEPDLASAMNNWDNRSPILLLVHEPDLADKYSRDSRISLQLSGHSHGGQVRMPGIGGLILPSMGMKYDYRLYRVNGMWLNTNPGLGVVHVPVRYNCPAEISEIILVRGTDILDRDICF